MLMLRLSKSARQLSLAAGAPLSRARAALDAVEDGSVIQAKKAAAEAWDALAEARDALGERRDIPEADGVVARPAASP